ncbi:MAG: EAL domain-containing protein [Pontibacterium sp.]
MPNNDLFVFTDEKAANDEPMVAAKRWKVLSVEDDPHYQASLVNSLKGFSYDGLPVEVLTATTALEASYLLSSDNDICLVLLDVVMEDDDAGLRLVNVVRDVIGNAAIRIVLLTGQPGMAPQRDVMAQYDINEYWNKADLTGEKLSSVVASNLRTYRLVSDLQAARKGLQMLVDASRALTDKRDLKRFSNSVLEHIGKLISVDAKLICLSLGEQESLSQSQVVAASREYSGYVGKNSRLTAGLLAMVSDEVNEAMEEALLRKGHRFGTDLSVLYFDNQDLDSGQYLVVVEASLKDKEDLVYLLQAYSENIQTGFSNIALINRLNHLAYYDQELNVLNTTWLKRELFLMPVAERSQSFLIYVDICDFNAIEISFGSGYSQMLLTEVYKRLRQWGAHARGVARTGNDAFALLFNRATLPDDLETLCSQEVEVMGVKHSLRTIVACLELGYLKGDSPSKVLQLARSLIYRGLESNQPVQHFNPDHKKAVTERYQLLSSLAVAVESKSLSIALQPKVNIQNNALVGFEALVRWQNEDGNWVPPDEFIPIAEASGLISQLDMHVLSMTQEARQVLDEAQLFMPIAFNASNLDLVHEGYLQCLDKMLAQENGRPNLFELEITETQSVSDYEVIKSCLSQLLAKGVRVSIDDFGTGYSSLSHVAHIEASALKIDKSFVDGLSNPDGRCEAIIDMILSLGRRFNLDVIAEGIETEEQLALLKAKGCHFGQGYYFAKPMPVAQAVGWAKRHQEIEGD